MILSKAIINEKCKVVEVGADAFLGDIEHDEVVCLVA